MGLDFHYRDVGLRPPTEEEIETAVPCEPPFRGKVVNLGDKIGRIAYVECNGCKWVARLEAF